jgi:diguanylate cyclase (GGDEF)-like protein/PAS domain S-box-containing protein
LFCYTPDYKYLLTGNETILEVLSQTQGAAWEDHMGNKLQVTKENHHFIKHFIRSILNTGAYEAICEGISIQDTDYKVVYQNTAHKKIFGSHPGEHCYKAYAHLDQVCEKCPVSMVFSKKRESLTEDLKFQKEKGVSFFSVSASAIKDKNGKIKAGIYALHDITEQRHETEKIIESEEKYRTVFKYATEAIYLVNPKTMKIVDCNQKALDLSGYSARTLNNMNIKDLYPDKEQDIVLKIFEKATAMGSLSGICGINQFRNNKIHVPVEMNLTTVRIQGKDFILCSVSDISKQKETERSLRDSEERFHKIFDLSPLGIAITNPEGRLIETNPAFQQMLGYTHDELQKGFIYLTYPEDLEENIKLFNEMVEGKRAYYEIEKRYCKKDGSLIWAKLYATAIKDNNGNFRYNLALIEDTTKQRITEEKLRSTAITDDLTGLFNRRGFFTLAEQQIRLAHRNSKWMSFLYMDFNGLKTINDKLGHKSGDQALIDSANILKRTFCESDIIARIGGDEFVVLITDLSSPSVEQIITDHLYDNLRIFNREGGRSYELLLSIGVTHYDPEHPCSLEELSSRAEASMYKNKQQDKFEIQAIKQMERRAHRRYSPGDKCLVSFENGETVRTKDISLGGVCLISQREVGIKSIHTIKISPRIKSEIKTKGQVVWSSCQGMRDYEAGLKFIELNSMVKKSLDKIIGALASKPDSP